MKNTAIIASSIVAAVAVIGIVAGVSVTNQAFEQTNYQRIIEESVSSKSESKSPLSNGTEFERIIEDSVQANITQEP